MTTKQNFEIGNYITWCVVIGSNKEKKFGVINSIKDNMLDVEVTSTLLSHGRSTIVQLHPLLDPGYMKVDLKVISVSTYKKLIKNIIKLLDNGIEELKKYKKKGQEIKKLVSAKNKVDKVIQAL